MEARHPAHKLREVMNLSEACSRAFFQCRRNHIKSFNVCGYLACEYMRLSGLPYDREAIDRILREWFDERTKDASYIPPFIVTTPGTIQIHTSGMPHENTQSPNIET